MKGELVVDTKEKNKHVVELFLKLREEGFEVKQESLELGDIQYGQLCIERKSAGDFLSSKNSDDFWSKIFQIKDSYKYPFLWLDYSDHELLRQIVFSYERASKRLRGYYNSYMGAVMALQLNRIPLINQFQRTEDAVDYIADLCKKIDKEGEYVPPTVKKKGKPIYQLRIQSIACCPGIGFKTAKEELEKYPTLGWMIDRLTEPQNEGKLTSTEKKLLNFYWGVKKECEK